MKSKKGFTIVELLAASVILLFVLTAVFSTYVLLSGYVQDTAMQAVLQWRARNAMDKITRSIRLASEAEFSLSGNKITLTYDPLKLGQDAGATWDAEYELSGSQILFTPDTSLGGQVVLVKKVDLDAGETLFEDWGNDVVSINLKLKNPTVSSEQYVTLTTFVKLRNAD